MLKYTAISDTLIYKGIQIIVGIIILIFAHLLGNIISKAISNIGKVDLTQLKLSKDSTTNKEKYQQENRTSLIFVTLGNISYYAIIIVSFFIVLRVLGIESTSLIALLGATGFAIGLAIQGTLSDVASGVLLAILQTYSIGEIIQVDDVEGKVVDFTILNTVIQEIESDTIITIPNRKIQESIIQNHSRQPIRYLVHNITISNKENDLEKIKTILKTMLLTTDGILDNPPPSVEVEEVNHLGTVIRVKAAIHSRDYADLNDPIRTKIRQTLTDNKIELKI